MDSILFSFFRQDKRDNSFFRMTCLMKVIRSKPSIDGKWLITFTGCYAIYRSFVRSTHNLKKFLTMFSLQKIVISGFFPEIIKSD
jgi:hypothetical protein